MATTVNFVPSVESVVECDIYVDAFQVGVGDSVTKDQVVMRVETDKAPQEVRVPEAGVITSFFVNPGDVKVKANAPLFAYDKPGIVTDLICITLYSYDV